MNCSNLKRYGCLAMLAFLLPGCGGETKAPGPLVMDDTEMERWEIDLVEMRIEKNEAFMDSAQTPLPAEVFASFEGLNYYYPEPALRFRVPLVLSDDPDTFILQKRKGEKVPYLRKGEVHFRAREGNHILAVFFPADATKDQDLWLPFYDATNEDQTYPGGRYLDLELLSDGTVEVDFNYAYNPLCDYNPTRYNCTLPPEENRLNIPIPAGEKRFRPEE